MCNVCVLGYLKNTGRSFYEDYPENKFSLRILPLQRYGDHGAHGCRVC